MSRRKRTSLTDLESLGRLLKYQPFDVDQCQCSNMTGSSSTCNSLLSLLIKTFCPFTCDEQRLLWAFDTGKLVRNRATEKLVIMKAVMR